MQIEDIGKTIKKVEIEDKNALILFEDGDELEVTTDTYSHFYLYSSKRLSTDELEAIIEYDEISKAKSYAFKLINSKSYSEHQIKEKLFSKKYKSKVIYATLDLLKKEKYIDDEKYAYEILALGNSKNYGKNRIITLLNKANVDEKIISSLEFNFETEYEKAKIQFEKYCNSNQNKSFKKRKQSGYSHLVSLGFESEICSSIISSYDEEDKENKDEKILINQINKYIIIHHIDLDDYESRQRISNAFFRKGFSYDLINKVLGGITNER